MDKENQIFDPKLTTKNTVPPKTLKLSCNTSLESSQSPFNKTLMEGNFPNKLMVADISPVF